MNNYKIISLKPRLSEKAYALSQEHNLYVFVVPKNANKHTVASAVAAQFDVTVENVNMIRTKAKSKRTVRRGGRPISGTQSGIKKAYVTIKAGQTIPVFQNEDDDAKTKPEKKDK
jgi:ribosomal protein L23